MRYSLVTGASGAIGRACALRLAQSGYKVWLMGRSQERLSATAEALGEASAGILQCDLTNKESVDECVSRVLASTPLHVLVNNAGITSDDLFMRMSEEAWDAVLDTNLKSVFLLTQKFLRSMTKERFGRIINISSVVGVTGNVGQANYAAAKAGLIGMSKSLAREVVSRGVTVNCVAPGLTQSAMIDAIPEVSFQKILQTVPMGRVGEPEEIAHAVAFLADEKAGYITGQTIHVNGGSSMF